MRRRADSCRYAPGISMARLPRLNEVAAAAVFLASDRAGATTGTVLDLRCGAIVN